MYVPYQIYYSSSVWEWDHTKVEHIIMSRLRLRMVRPWSDQLDRFRRLCGMDHWNGLLDWPFCTNNHVYLQYNDTALSLVRKLVIGSQLCIHQAMNFNKARRSSRMSPNLFHVDGSRYETIFCPASWLPLYHHAYTWLQLAPINTPFYMVSVTTK